MKITSILLTALCGSAILLASSANATVLKTETFTYADGNLVGNGDWSAHSGAGNVPIQVDSGQAVLTHGGGSREDANTGFPTKSAGILSYAFDLSVDDPGGPYSTGDDEYFISLGATNFTTSLPGRVYIIPPTSGGDFSLGVRSSSSGTIAALSSDFSFASTVAVALDYDINTNTASLTAGGSSASGDVEGPDVDIEVFNVSLRQSNSATDETIRVDNLVISHVPEPTSIALMIAGLLGMGVMRRK